VLAHRPGGKAGGGDFCTLGGAAWRRDVGQGKGHVHMLLAELGSGGNYSVDWSGVADGRKA